MTETATKKKVAKKKVAKKKAAKGRRSEAVSNATAPKKSKTISNQKELIDKHVPEHAEILKVAKRAYEASVEEESWKSKREAALIKLAAIIKKSGIKGPYQAGKFVVKPKERQAQTTCTVQKKGDD